MSVIQRTPFFVALEGTEFINRERLVLTVEVDVDAAARVAHVREFLERVDRHFPEGVPLAITYAIRDELELLEAAVVERAPTDPAASLTASATSPDAAANPSAPNGGHSGIFSTRPCAHCGADTRALMDAWACYANGHRRFYCNQAHARANGAAIY